MFEQLDDPSDFEPSDDFRDRVGARARQIRRRRWTATAGGGLATVLVATMAIVGAVQWRVDQIDRVDIQTGPAATSNAPEGVEFILLVGTDPAGRADTVAVARVDRSQNRLDVLSIPRDYVPPGSSKRISEISVEGAQAVIDAVWPQADHYVQLDFDGFRSIIDALGGVAIEVFTPIRDAGSGLDLDRGCSVLDGEAALAFARSRRLESLLSNGIWGSDPYGDIGRVDRSHLLLGSLAAAGHANDLSPARMNDLLNVLVDHATIDNGLGMDELVDLAWWLHGVDPGATVFETMPVAPGTLGTASVLLPTDETAPAVERFRQGAPPAIEAGPPPAVMIGAVPPSGRCD